MLRRLKIVPILIITIILTGSVFALGFNNARHDNPMAVYHVYLDGKSIGMIKEKEELENYINNEQSALKDKYQVERVYLPVGLEIKKEITYKTNISTAKEIYNKIKGLKPFTINGYIITIKGIKQTNINVIDKQIFIDAVNRTIKAFIGEDRYQAFLDNNQKEIIDFGTRIDDIYIDEEITIKQDHISTDELIFTNEKDLTKYLLFGTLAKQDRYKVKLGDTIETVAYNNNLSIDEFMVANPQFTDPNNLLYQGQEVVIGLINPKFSVVEERHVVEKEIKEYRTEIKYDNKMLVGNGYQLRAGVNGEDKVTRKLMIINGKIEDVVPLSYEELKPAINRIYVKGGKVIPNIGDNNFWAWPTTTPYIITSVFGPRWGSHHDAVDIAGCGYGSPIYAANNGTVYKTGYDRTSGNYIIINHNNGYYTWYGHLSRLYVKVGNVVQRGQRIAAMGNTGYHPLTGHRVGTHLHFGVYVGAPHSGGVAINPLRLYQR